MKLKFLFTFIVSSILLVSCSDGKSSSSSSSSRNDGALTCSTDKVIIGGELDWFSREEIDDYNQRANSLAVGQLKLPAQFASCTAFLINKDTIMTNNHCVTRASDLKNSTFNLYDENENRQSYKCRTFLGSKPSLDYALIKCENNPGDKHGYVYLDTQAPEVGNSMYVVQENCNYIDEPYCEIDRYVSYGDIIDIRGSRITHLADTLPGSSGSPIVSLDKHKVIALHNAGSTTSTSAFNYGIPMNKIIKSMQQYFPRVEFSTDLNIRAPRSNIDRSPSSCAE
ncbi:MAG: hypothetical protein CME62_06870 [Halobacteriovoraceae bacterium]|nr:hypothetical protein [Halobacteriovoraceae bacterium]|tara:strand:+ start:7695 stop:8540 length:846 start_codon:yes stop_codon:yes gene_type:complete